MLDGVTETTNVAFFLHRETKEQIIIRSIPLWFCKLNEDDKKEFIEELKDLKIFDFSEQNSYYPSFLQVVGSLNPLISFKIY